MSDQPDKEPLDPIHELAVGLAPVFHHLAEIQDEMGHAVAEAVQHSDEGHEIVEAHIDSGEEHYVQAHDEAPTTIDAGDYHLSPAEHDLPSEA